MNPDIKFHEDLASHPQLNFLIFLLLSAAQSGGMAESQAKKLYDEIHGHFSNIHGEVFWSFRDELVCALMMEEGDFDWLDKKDDLPFPGYMN